MACLINTSGSKIMLRLKQIHIRLSFWCEILGEENIDEALKVIEGHPGKTYISRSLRIPEPASDSVLLYLLNYKQQAT